MALSNEDHKDVKGALGKAMANKISKVTRDKKPSNSLGIRMNSRQEDLKLAQRLYKEYEAKGDKRNMEISARNIKNFTD